MTDDEHAAALCSIALTALMGLPEGSRPRSRLGYAAAEIRHELARLRNCTPEDIQNEFERRATS